MPRPPHTPCPSSTWIIVFETYRWSKYEIAKNAHPYSQSSSRHCLCVHVLILAGCVSIQYGVNKTVRLCHSYTHAENVGFILAYYFCCWIFTDTIPYRNLIEVYWPTFDLSVFLWLHFSTAFVWQLHRKHSCAGLKRIFPLSSKLFSIIQNAARSGLEHLW